ncbi:hypothetical protein SAMN06265338_1245 [Rhodoblastus acidophilus]|uniref:Uncharacterized protein n=1 Tax=Rhodoblastus acidophilus TaxID=1074 RepID=A0A212SBV1_RHOAC|nr:hypothetical protein [Rhodoblastus acidophilus]MCW2315281.1 xanthine dehydrogenase molybdopterin-binding subunit B [Rhodoblastus acidophilus]SNB83001.1 hypothetical protein SAMN06265338_1245 [Rhodoblastus acidophilus]
MTTALAIAKIAALGGVAACFAALAYFVTQCGLSARDDRLDDLARTGRTRSMS